MLLGPVIAVASLVALGRVFGLRISLTDSAAPAGLYRIVRGVSIERGELVGACLPTSIAQEGLARGYLRKGDCPGGIEPVAKIVGALPGDVLEVQPGWVSVDGQVFSDSAVAARDSIDRPLSHVPWGRRQVAQGEVWMFGFRTCGAGTPAASDRFHCRKFRAFSSRFSPGESWRQTDIATSKDSGFTTSPILAGWSHWPASTASHQTSCSGH